MNRILCFKPHFRVEIVNDREVFLVAEQERFLLKGERHALVARLLDGTRSEWDIVEALSGKLSPPEVYYTILQWEQGGYLTEVSPQLSPEAAAFWHGLGISAAQASRRLLENPVAVLAPTGEDLGPLREALSGAGVSVREDAPSKVVLVRDYLDPSLDTINRQALRERFRWVPLKAIGASAWFGPVFQPGEGPCWMCLAQRLRANRPVETFLARRLGQKEPLFLPRAELSISTNVALSLFALTLSRFIAEGKGPLEDKLLVWLFGQLRIEEHAVTRRPQCPACGDPALVKKRVEAPIVLQSRPRRFTEDGGYRSVTPEETFARYQHLISPLTGVVTDVGPVPGRSHPLRQVHRAAHFLCPPPERDIWVDEFSRTSLGKGRTAAQSRAGALSEAIERYSCVFQEDEPLIKARLSELGEEAISPVVLQNFSATQYQQREVLNRSQRDFRRLVPRPFDERVAIDWVPAWSLTHNQRRYLPATYCYQYVPCPPEEEFCYLDPNGHAAGNCLEEAILQAFFELAERDAVGIWWYNRVKRPAVDLASFEQPYFADLEAHYHSMGYRLWLLDLTNDLEIPAFVALAHAAEGDRYCIGFGCHLEARLGVQRALTELNQFFDTAGEMRAPWGDAPLEDPSFLLPDNSLPLRKKDDFGEVSGEDIREDVLFCIKRAAHLGLETVVLDQTRPDIGLCAVKVVVPGLRHFWPRFGPGRLYDTPVKLGWLPEARAEGELNPVPLYL